MSAAWSLTSTNTIAPATCRALSPAEAQRRRIARPVCRANCRRGMRTSEKAQRCRRLAERDFTRRRIRRARLRQGRGAGDRSREPRRSELANRQHAGRSATERRSGRGQGHKGSLASHPRDAATNVVDARRLGVRTWLHLGLSTRPKASRFRVEAPEKQRRRRQVIAENQKPG